MTARCVPRLRLLLAGEVRRQRGRLLAAGASAAAVAAAAVLLLGVSGWFLTAASLAGAAGAAAAATFNALLPSAGIRLLAILRTGGRYAERLSGHDAALRAMANIRPALFRAMAAAPARAMAMTVGDATARMVQDVSELEVALVQRASIWAAAAAGVSGACLLLLAGGWCATMLVVMLAATLLGGRLLAARMDRHGGALPPANGRLKQEFSTLVAAASELRAYGLERWAADRIDTHAATLLAAQRTMTGFAGWLDLLLATGTGCAAGLTLVTARSAPLPVAALAVLGAVVSVEGMAALVRSLQHRGRLHAAETRLEGLLDPGEIDRTITVVPHAMAWPPSIGIRDFATVLTPGTMAGLCGPSGCGKTTLIAQMLGLRGAVHGRISLGGVALEDIPPDASRRCFAAALQDAALLSGTVRDNLLLADAAATDDALYAALHDAALDVRVRAMPHGLDSWIGEDGARLSGGERRRLVLARALIRPAPWLLLDEPTEGLDAGTEKLVVQRLRARLRRRGQGAMIVSHRPALLAGCDIVLDMAADAAAWQGRALRSSAA